MNHVFVIGRIEETKKATAGQGTPVLRLRIRSIRRWTDRNGSDRTSESWHTVCVYGNLAKQMAGSCRKGSVIAAAGQLRTRTFEGRDGQKRNWSEIAVASQDGIEVLDHYFSGDGSSRPARGDGEGASPDRSGRRDGGTRRSAPEPVGDEWDDF